MATNRSAAEKIILQWVNEVDTSGTSGEVLKEFFAAMSDKDFHDYMVKIRDGQDYISFIMENLKTKKGVTVDNNLKVAEKMGVPLFQRVWYTDPATGTVFLTNEKYLVVHLPIRRQIQTLQNKMSVPEDNKHVDDLTDQVTGVSKGSSLSQPETLVLSSQGLINGIEEMIRVRGGDIKMMNAVDMSILQTGGASIKALDIHNSRTKAGQTLNTLLKGALLDNNF